MELLKWVVKGVKDEFNPESLELKVKQQEEKIKKLDIQIGWLKFNNLSEWEREWAINSFTLLTWHWYFSKELDEFVCQYINDKEKRERESLTFNDEPLPF